MEFETPSTPTASGALALRGAAAAAVGGHGRLLEARQLPLGHLALTLLLIAAVGVDNEQVVVLVHLSVCVLCVCACVCVCARVDTEQVDVQRYP